MDIYSTLYCITIIAMVIAYLILGYLYNVGNSLEEQKNEIAKETEIAEVGESNSLSEVEVNHNGIVIIANDSETVAIGSVMDASQELDKEELSAETRTDITPTDIPQTNFCSTTLVPIVITIAILVFIYQMFKTIGNFVLSYIAIRKGNEP